MLVNILSLQPGDRVRLRRTFRDFDGATHVEGTELVLGSRDYFPHDGGYTFRFADGTMIRLAENDPSSLPVLADRDGVFFERAAR